MWQHCDCVQTKCLLSLHQFDIHCQQKSRINYRMSVWFFWGVLFGLCLLRVRVSARVGFETVYRAPPPHPLYLSSQFLSNRFGTKLSLYLILPTTFYVVKPVGLLFFFFFFLSVASPFYS